MSKDQFVALAMAYGWMPVANQIHDGYRMYSRSGYNQLWIGNRFVERNDLNWAADFILDADRAIKFLHVQKADM